MGSYILQREKYLSKVVELRSDGMGYGRISKIIPVPEETIRRWCIKFAPTTQQVHSTMKESAQTKVCETNQQHLLPDDVLSLQAELKRLRAQLVDAEIKAEAYDELINVAEAKFGIRIRKKAGAKQ